MEVVYLGGGISRNVSPQIDGSTQRSPYRGDPKFWIASIRGEVGVGAIRGLSLKGEKASSEITPT